MTEERLRYHLDSNQMGRESMCLALLPLLGPFTRERSRRPKGGPDDGRDIEAIYNGSLAVWGAVGFRNGGGNDDAARSDAEEKFDKDLTRALKENPVLPGFVFFTNVDLTPGRKEILIRNAQARGPSLIEIFDLNILRHTLDSAEGLIPRLQYLGIAMDPTEQIGLVNKFGTQLQNAVTARFDRVERTLGQLERFLDMQKPILRLDAYFQMKIPTSSYELGNEAALLEIHGLQNIDKTLFLLCINQPTHAFSERLLVMRAHLWLGETPANVISVTPYVSQWTNVAAVATEISITSAGRVSLADLTILRVSATCSERLRDLIQSIALDANGYELFNCPANHSGDVSPPVLQGEISTALTGKNWKSLLTMQSRNMLERPPERSPRFASIGPIIFPGVSPPTPQSGAIL